MYIPIILVQEKKGTGIDHVVISEKLFLSVPSGQSASMKCRFVNTAPSCSRFLPLP
jgi:hypothetical protein